MNFKLILIASMVSAFLYRVGGSDWKWASEYRTKARDIGCPLVLLAVLAIAGQWSWWLILSFVMLIGFLTTYNKWVGCLLGYSKEDVHAPSWIFTGLTYGLPILPYAISKGLMTGWWFYWLATAAIFIFFRLVDCPIRKLDVYWEELGSGLSFIITLPLLFL